MDKETLTIPLAKANVHGRNAHTEGADSLCGEEASMQEGRVEAMKGVRRTECNRSGPMAPESCLPGLTGDLGATSAAVPV